MLLVIDNYDSFVHNLSRYLVELGADVVTVRNDDSRILDDSFEPDGVVISPGPGAPCDAGLSLRAISHYFDRCPIVGVCLGHQAIAEAFGATITRHAPRHGKTSTVQHHGTGLFAGLPSPFKATRYHSLVAEADSIPDELTVTAWTDDGTVMGLEHRSRPIFGVQFHPESILTEHGYELLANFVRLTGIDPQLRPKTIIPQQLNVIIDEMTISTEPPEPIAPPLPTRNWRIRTASSDHDS